MDESDDWSIASRRRGPSLIHAGLVVDEIVLEQAFWGCTSLLTHPPRLHCVADGQVYHLALVQ
jgi:hypothetical protein